MNRSLAVLVVAFCAAAGCSAPVEEAPVDAGPKPPPPPGVLLGTIVLVDADGTAAPRANLALALSPGGRSVRTGTDGSFRVEGLPAGRYLLRAELDLDDDGRTDTGFTRRGLVLTAEAGLDLGRVEAGRLGDAAGRVTVSGTPLEGVIVGVSSLGAGSGSERVARSDSHGEFRLRGLLPGDYLVRAIAPGPEPRGAETTTFVPPSGIGWAEVALGEALQGATSLRGVVNAGADTGTEFTLEVLGGDQPVSRTVTAAQVFEAPVDPGLYVVRIASAQADVPAVTVRDVVAFGTVELDPVIPAKLPGLEERDFDADGTPAASDPDDDGDGCVDAQEPAATRLDATSCTDLDGDGLGDGLDPDDDGDGEIDVLDACPNRSDPHAAPVRPSGCAPYPGLDVLASAPSTALTDEPQRVRLSFTGGVGDVTLGLTLAPEAGVTEPLGEGAWDVTFTAPGTHKLLATAHDAIQEASAEVVVVVEAPPILVDLPATVDTEAGVGFTVAARVFEPISPLEYTWSEVVPENAAPVFELSDAGTAQVSAIAAVPGSATLRVRVSRGARSGEATTVVTAWGAPLAVSIPREVELTVGVPLELAAELADPPADVAYAWAGLGDGGALVLENVSEPVVLVDATTPGEYRLGVRASASLRSGAATTRVRAYAPGTLDVVEHLDHLARGERRAGTLVADPPLDSPVVTWTPAESNPEGGALSNDGLAFSFRADSMGEWRYDVLAISGARAARGTVVIVVDAEPIPVTISRTPSSAPVAAGTLVTLTASASGLPDDAEVTWTWTPRATNPSGATIEIADEELSFTSSVGGAYTFDATIRSGPRGGSASATIVVAGDDAIDLYGYFFSNRVGKTLETWVRWDDDLVSPVVTWIQDPANPAVLELHDGDPGYFWADPTVPGLYRLTAAVSADGRSGTFVFEIPVLAELDGASIELTSYPSAASTVAGANEYSSITVDTLEVVCHATVTWTADPQNPEEFDPADFGHENYVPFKPTRPGTYRFTGVMTGDDCNIDTPTPRTATASASLKVYPAMQVSVAVDGGVQHAPLRLIGKASKPGVRWAWNVRTTPRGCYSGSPPLDGSNTPTVELRYGPLCAGTYVFRANVFDGPRLTTLDTTVVVTASAPRWLDLPDTGATAPSYLAAVGVPYDLRAFATGFEVTRWSWRQDPADLLRANLSGTDGPVLRFTPDQVGDYRFLLQIEHFAKRPSTTPTEYRVRVRVVQSQPAAYVDGPAGVPLLIEPASTAFAPADPSERPGAIWACRSGRTDVANVKWERTTGEVDTEPTLEGAFLLHRSRTLEHRLAAWKCTITTTGGQVFTATRPVVLSTNTTGGAWSVAFVRPSGATIPTCTTRPLASGCLGTFDDPFVRLSQAISTSARAVVLLAGEETLTAPLNYQFEAILGGVSATTWRQTPALTPSRLIWAQADFTQPLVPLAGGGGDYTLAMPGTLDGVELVVRAKAGATTPVTVVQAAAMEGLHVARSVIDVQANPTQVVTAVQLAVLPPLGSTPNPAGSISGNRLVVQGGTGTGVIVERCLGSLIAHNAISVSSTSGLTAGVLIDCSGTHKRRPMHVVNNLVSMDNGQAAFAIAGAPATDLATATVQGHRFAGNWFRGSGAIALVTGPSARTLSTAAAVNAGFALGGLDGGGNTTDPACLTPTLPTNLWSWAIAAGSTCVGAAKVAAPQGRYDLGVLARDAAGLRRNLVNGWAAPDGDGSIDLGPGEL